MEENPKRWFKLSGPRKEVAQLIRMPLTDEYLRGGGQSVSPVPTRMRCCQAPQEGGKGHLPNEPEPPT